MGNSKNQNPTPLSPQMAMTLLKSTQFSSHSIELKKIPKNELIEVGFENNIIGPIHYKELKALSIKYSVSHLLKVRLYNSKNWINIYNHPMFERRTNHANAPLFSDKDQIKVLVDGQQVKTMTIRDLTKAISNKDILFTDLASIDNGNSWMKICHIENFDRREIAKFDLPSYPDSVLKSNIQEKITEKDKEKTDEVDAMVSLAYTSNIINEDVDSNSILKKPSSKKTISILVIVLISTVSLLSINQESKKDLISKANRSISSTPRTNKYKRRNVKRKKKIIKREIANIPKANTAKNNKDIFYSLPKEKDIDDKDIFLNSNEENVEVEEMDQSWIVQLNKKIKKLPNAENELLEDDELIGEDNDTSEFNERLPASDTKIYQESLDEIEEGIYELEQ